MSSENNKLYLLWVNYGESFDILAIEILCNYQDDNSRALRGFEDNVVLSRWSAGVDMTSLEQLSPKYLSVHCKARVCYARFRCRPLCWSSLAGQKRNISVSWKFVYLMHHISNIFLKSSLILRGLHNHLKV